MAVPIRKDLKNAFGKIEGRQLVINVFDDALLIGRAESILDRLEGAVKLRYCTLKSLQLGLAPDN